jgi:hypothetical protein
MDEHDDVSQVTIDVLEHLQHMYDAFESDTSSPVAYTTFITQSHAYVRQVQHDLPEYEIYLVHDVHYDLLAAAFVKHFKKKQKFIRC